GFRYSPRECTSYTVPTLPLDTWLDRQGLVAAQVGLVWSDTQGFESEVIESGGRLWDARVPLWVEVWPRGLNAHGGIAKILQLTRQHFRCFLTESQLHSVRPEPLNCLELARLVESLEGRAFQDVLLIP